MHVDRRLLGWGLFFIIVGAIPLATRAGALDPELVGKWPSLWPLLLIGWGLGLLLRRTPVEWVGGAVAAIVFGIMGGGLLASGFAGAPISTDCRGGTTAGTAFASQSGTLGRGGRMDVAVNCGRLDMRPVAGDTWTVSGTETQGRAPTVKSDGSSVIIEGPEHRSFFGDAGRTDWAIDVPRDLDLSLGIEVNAGDAHLDLPDTNLGSINLTVNAGRAILYFGGSDRLGDLNATVNAGSAEITIPPGSHQAHLSINAGSLSVCFDPAGAVRVSFGGALGSNNFDAAGLTKIDTNTWTSTGWDASSPYLDLDVTANAGSFTLDREGTCSV